MNHKVVASVFQKKLRRLIAGLRTADKFANGKKFHEYVIADLKIGSATIALNEIRDSKMIPELSSVDVYRDCVVALTKSDYKGALNFGETVDQIAKFSEEAEKTFSHMVLSIGSDDAIRVDKFLERQTVNALKLIAMLLMSAALWRWASRLRSGCFERRTLAFAVVWAL